MAVCLGGGAGPWGSGASFYRLMEYGADELGCICGGRTTDRIVKIIPYAKAGTGFCLCTDQAATSVPMVHRGGLIKHVTDDEVLAEYEEVA
ncbi:hypothetical protein [Streptomyces longispororuber]|uniref:hypothetical protein n=1 Tax=Streptomyces longispororuber TaxID=68230 RepID=UPI0036FE1CB3